MTLETPEAVLAWWLGETREDASALQAQARLWFTKSEATDAEIRARFGDTLNALKAGLAEDWARQGTQARLAAIIVLDQFSRNMHRGTPGMFATDAQALALAREAVEAGEDEALSEVERVFLYLPYEHSEAASDQERAVELFEKLQNEAREDFRAYAETTLDYAHQHKAVIDRFGRFPHRNGVLERENTPEEAAYLAEPGAGF